MSDKNVDTQAIVDLLYAPMEGVRQRRKFIETEWLLNYRAWQGWPSQSYQMPLPDGAIHYFIPHARRAIERNVARIIKLEMPATEWFETLPFDDVSHLQAEKVHSVMRYIMQKKIQVKRLISSLARTLQLYNFAVLNTSVIIKNNEVWPFQKDIDPFTFYIFPDTAATCDEALMLFEDTIIPYQVYDAFVNHDDPQGSMYLPLDVDELHVPEWPYHLIERLAYRGLTGPSALGQGTGRYSDRQFETAKRTTTSALVKEAKAFVSLSKCYFRIASEWYYAVICHNTAQPCVVRLDSVENTPHYRWATTRPMAGELYTNSQMDDIRVLQNLCNTAMSQVEAHRTAAAEAPIAINSNNMARLSDYTYGNRQWWKIDGDPREAIMPLPVAGTFEEGLQATQVYLGWLNQLAGGGQMAEGSPGRNMPRAGGALQSLIDLAMADTEDIASTLEQELLTPGLSDIYHILVEYVPAEQIFKIPGVARQAPQVFNKQDLMGDYTFSWQGALGFQDTQQRADKLLQLAQMLLNPQVLQMLQQQGQTVGIVDFLKTILSSGLGERGLSNIIVPVPDAQMQQQQAAQQQAQQQAQLQQQLAQQHMQNETDKVQIDMAKVQSTAQSQRVHDQTRQADTQIKYLKTIHPPTNGARR